MPIMSLCWVTGRRAAWFVVYVLSCVACSSGDFSSASADGGMLGTAGSATSGGSSATGGSVSTGNTAGSGATGASGGTAASGGVNAAGNANSGGAGRGGTFATGGVVGAGAAPVKADPVAARVESMARRVHARIPRLFTCRTVPRRRPATRATTCAGRRGSRAGESPSRARSGPPRRTLTSARRATAARTPIVTSSRMGSAPRRDTSPATAAAFTAACRIRTATPATSAFAALPWGTACRPLAKTIRAAGSGISARAISRRAYRERFRAGRAPVP